MPATPTYALPYPAPTDPADVPTDMGELAVAVEGALVSVAASDVVIVTAAELAALTPTNGMQVVLVDSKTAPTFAWHLLYDSAVTDAYKWVCVGGSARVVRGETDFPTGAALALNPPRPGIYEHGQGGVIYAAVVDTIYALYLTIDGTPNVAYTQFRSGYVGSQAGVMGYGASVATATVVQTLAPSTGGTRVERRWISQRPVRIG